MFRGRSEDLSSPSPIEGRNSGPNGILINRTSVLMTAPPGLNQLELFRSQFADSIFDIFRGKDRIWFFQYSDPIGPDRFLLFTHARINVRRKNIDSFFAVVILIVFSTLRRKRKVNSLCICVRWIRVNFRDLFTGLL